MSVANYYSLSCSYLSLYYHFFVVQNYLLYFIYFLLMCRSLMNEVNPRLTGVSRVFVIFLLVTSRRKEIQKEETKT